MGVLAERSSAAMNTNDVAEADRLAKVQSTFVKDHLPNWTPFFARDMRLFAKTDPYLGLADLLEGFLLEDEALLDELASK